MAHNKFYAICENKCKVETLSKETLDYRYSQTDNRLMKINSSLSAMTHELEKLKTRVAQAETDFQNFYIVEYTELIFKIGKMEKTIEELKAEIAKVNDTFQNFYITEYTDLSVKVNALEKRVEALENA